MARKPRNQPNSEFQHITNQGARRGDIFLDQADRDQFLWLLGKASAKYGVIIHAICLMGNHYHLVAQFPDRNMTQVMHWLGTCYSQYVNRRYDFTGRLCRDRYFNNPIDSDAYLLTAVRYVHRNPKDLGVPIHELDSYRYSSYSSYLGKGPKPVWLETELVLNLFSQDRAELRQFTEKPLPIDARTA